MKSFYIKHQNLLNVLLIIFVTLLTFQNSLNCYFSEADDFNVLLHTKRSIVSTFLTNTYGGESGGNYRPMEVFSHLFDINVYGDENPFGRRITNLLFHLLNGILVYFLGYNLTKNKSIGLISGLLFSTHIIHSYALTPVTWISGRTDLIVTFFFLLTLVLFIKSVSRNSLLLYLISCTIYVLALLSKEVAVTLPIMIFIYQIVFLRNDASDNGFLGEKPFYFTFLTFISAGFILFILGIIVSPSFVASHLSPDGMLKEQGILRIKHFQSAAVIGGGALIFLSGIIILLLKYSKKISRLLNSIRYSIPYFYLMFLYLIIRSAIVGGFGGAYITLEGNIFLQLGIDTFMRDIFALVGLIWPVGNDYNIAVFKLQVQNPIIFYSVSVIVLIGILYLGYRLITTRNKILIFTYFWIFVILVPAHNFLIPTWQFQSRLLYLPIVGFCLFIVLIIYKVNEVQQISPKIFKVLIFIFFFSIVAISSVLIMKNNFKLVKDSEVTKVFVSDMKKYKAEISDSTNLFIINYPDVSINSLSNIWISAFMGDILNFIKKDYSRKANYSILMFSKNENKDSLNVKIVDRNNLEIYDCNPSKYFVIPNELAAFDRKIKNIWGIIPHALVQSLPAVGQSTETGAAIIKASKSEETSKINLMVSTKKYRSNDGIKNLYFIYINNQFELLN